MRFDVRVRCDMEEEIFSGDIVKGADDAMIGEEVVVIFEEFTVEANVGDVGSGACFEGELLRLGWAPSEDVFDCGDAVVFVVCDESPMPFVGGERVVVDSCGVAPGVLS